MLQLPHSNGSCPAGCSARLPACNRGMALVEGMEVDHELPLASESSGQRRWARDGNSDDPCWPESMPARPPDGPADGVILGNRRVLLEGGEDYWSPAGMGTARSTAGSTEKCFLRERGMLQEWANGDTTHSSSASSKNGLDLGGGVGVDGSGLVWVDGQVSLEGQGVGAIVVRLQGPMQCNS
ncbi:hypothetical protein CALCODRAFT_513254 [Calocera cornea HHB12733]|uniref:Uncharacterized protein n=1 Tax=Calocera cornea HHB12733 TaxID=1353952 RepID=A0A165CAQ0_9BASI|nr:hypothetical protein CALCODRAFT_513254 [Calocera cornea HHB12733]